MIEALGWITLYLLVGIALLPIPMLVDKLTNAVEGKRILWIYVLLWPFTGFVGLILVWAIAWEEFKNYK